MLNLLLWFCRMFRGVFSKRFIAYYNCVELAAGHTEDVCLVYTNKVNSSKKEIRSYRNNQNNLFGANNGTGHLPII